MKMDARAFPALLKTLRKTRNNDVPFYHAPYATLCAFKALGGRSSKGLEALDESTQVVFFVLSRKSSVWLL